MYVMAVFAVGVFLIQRAYIAFRGNYEPFARKAKAAQSIYEVSVLGDYEEGTRDVEVFTFRIRGKPESFVELWSPDCDLFDEAAHIGLVQIGKTRISASHRDTATGRSGGGSVDIGPNSSVKRLLPLTVRNLDELIERYDEMDAYFSQFADESSLGTVQTSPTYSIEVHVYPRR
jgi:hypothetical protein